MGGQRGETSLKWRVMPPWTPVGAATVCFCFLCANLVTWPAVTEWRIKLNIIFLRCCRYTGTDAVRQCLLYCNALLLAHWPVCQTLNHVNSVQLHRSLRAYRLESSIGQEVFIAQRLGLSDCSQVKTKKNGNEKSHSRSSLKLQ